MSLPIIQCTMHELNHTSHSMYHVQAQALIQCTIYSLRHSFNVPCTGSGTHSMYHVQPQAFIQCTMYRLRHSFNVPCTGSGTHLMYHVRWHFSICFNKVTHVSINNRQHEFVQLIILVSRSMLVTAKTTSKFMVDTILLQWRLLSTMSSAKIAISFAICLQ